MVILFYFFLLQLVLILCMKAVVFLNCLIGQQKT